MASFISRMRIVLMVLCRCGLFLLTVTALVLFFVSVWLEQFLRRVTPLMLAGLPPHYRQFLLWMAAPSSQNATVPEHGTAE
jgi:hypothetical protein